MAKDLRNPNIDLLTRRMMKHSTKHLHQWKRRTPTFLLNLHKIFNRINLVTNTTLHFTQDEPKKKQYIRRKYFSNVRLTDDV